MLEKIIKLIIIAEKYTIGIADEVLHNLIHKSADIIERKYGVDVESQADFWIEQS